MLGALRDREKVTVLCPFGPGQDCGGFFFRCFRPSKYMIAAKVAAMTTTVSAMTTRWEAPATIRNGAMPPSASITRMVPASNSIMRYTLYPPATAIGLLQLVAGTADAVLCPS